MTEIGPTIEGTEKFLGIEQAEIKKGNSSKIGKPTVGSKQVLKSRTPTTIGPTIEGTEKFLGIDQKEITKGNTNESTTIKSAPSSSPKN